MAKLSVPSICKFKNKNLVGLFASATLFVLLGACAHHRDVRPGADGLHRVALQTDDTDRASREAISQAEHYCKERNLSAAFVDEKSQYTGSMDEDSYKTAKTASKVAQGVGSAAWVFGGRRESTAGGIVGLGGAIADGAIGKGYTVEMKFKCQ